MTNDRTILITGVTGSKNPTPIMPGRPLELVRLLRDSRAS
jgi:hypothetical protein